MIPYEVARIFTSVEVSIRGFPYNIQPEDHKRDNFTVSTQLVPFGSTGDIPLWILIVSILVGILILAGVTYGLVKAGFFQRQKRAEMQRLMQSAELQQPITCKEETSDVSSSRESLNALQKMFGSEWNEQAASLEGYDKLHAEKH